jgi:hypothetical protein
MKNLRIFISEADQENYLKKEKNLKRINSILQRKKQIEEKQEKERKKLERKNNCCIIN